MVQERSTGSQNGPENLTPKEDIPEEWFKIACQLASHGKQEDAELAIRVALKDQNEYPIAWAILSAILLSQGKETDAEKAGKKAISQCKDLKMTWTKIRSIILSQGVIRGASWKDPRRVVIEAAGNSEWGKILGILGEASDQDMAKIASAQETLDDKEESQSKADDTSKEYTPTRSAAETEKKEYTPTRSEEETEKKEYTPTRIVDLTEKKKYESAGKQFQSHEDRVDEEQKDHQPLKVYGSTRSGDVAKKKGYESAERRFKSPKAKEPASKPRVGANASRLFATAETMLKKGNIDGAEDAFLKALKIDPSRGDAWFRVSSIRMGKHKYDEAIVALEYATEKMPQKAAAWYQLGYCYQKLNKWKEAIPPLKKATQLDKMKPDFWMALGLSEFHMGQFQFSSKSLLRVLRMSPNHKKALFYLAMCMEKQGNRKHSLSLYIKLLNIGGLKPTMLERMAGAFERLNRPREAREARRRSQIARRTGTRS